MEWSSSVRLSMAAMPLRPRNEMQRPIPMATTRSGDGGNGMTPTATLAQIVAMTGLTVLALGAGILVATIGGRWTM